MDYIKIDTNIVNQKIRVLDSDSYDIDGEFTIRNSNLEKLELTMTNSTKYKLVSAILCNTGVTDTVVNNVYTLIFNISREITTKHTTIITKNIPNKFVIKRDTILFTYTNIIGKEIKDCKDIDIYGLHSNPQHESGNIIIGYP